MSAAKTKSSFVVAYQEDKGDQSTAKVYFKEAYIIFLRALGPDDPETRAQARFGWESKTSGVNVANSKYNNTHLHMRQGNNTRHSTRPYRS